MTMYPVNDPQRRMGNPLPYNFPSVFTHSHAPEYPHVNREGKQNMTPGLAGGHYKSTAMVPAMCRSGTDRKLYKKYLYDQRRAASGRYVGPFPTHGAKREIS